LIWYRWNDLRVRDDDGRKLDHATLEAMRLRAVKRIEAGAREAAVIKAAAAATIPNDMRLRLDYLEIVDLGEMQPVEVVDGPVCVAGALWVGATRLIDNVICL